jgi:hypothetical protein
MPKQPIPEKYLQAIGKITVNFSILELKLAFCIWELIGSSQRIGQLVTAKLTFPQLIALLKSIYRERVKERSRQEKLLKLLDKAETAGRKRNAVVHAAWAVDVQNPQATMRFKIQNTRKGLQYKFEGISLDELNRTADFIEETAREISVLLSPLFRNLS